MTVAKNNGKLLQLLTERREVLQQLRLLHAHEMPTESFGTPAAELWKVPFQLLGFMRDEMYWLRKLAKVERDISVELTSKQFLASKVYVTFETERAQRRCLKRLTTGLIPAYADMSTSSTSAAFEVTTSFTSLKRLNHRRLSGTTWSFRLGTGSFSRYCLRW